MYGLFCSLSLFMLPRCSGCKFLSSTLLNLNFLPVKRQQRLHSFLRRRARNRFHFPDNWKIDGDYPPAGGQCNSFLGGIHRETQRRGERNGLTATSSVGQASRLSLTLDERP
jgi:hypothetical protein